MQHDSAGVSDDLEDETTDHANHESPCLIPNTETDLGDQEQPKSCRVDRVTGQSWKVFNLSAAEGACFHRAVGVS